MRVVSVHAVTSDRLELCVLRGGPHHQRREQLLEDISIATQKEAEELLHVVRDEIELEIAAHLRDRQRAGALVEADHLLGGQYVNAPEIPVRVRRRESVEV